MAVNLTAIFRVRDQGTSRLRRITQMMNRMTQTSRATNESVSRTQTAVSRFGNAVSSTSNHMNGFSASISRLHVGSNGLSASFGGLQSILIGLASAYLGAQGAAKAFNSTILAAANYEMSAVTIGALFDDATKTKKYMQSVEKMALDSPILNSTEMYSSSKGLIAMTKDLDTLAKTWSIIERLQLLDPAQGTEGASFAMKEMFGGDAISLSTRFELPKSELNRIKKLDPAGQVVELDKLLVKMGYTQKAVNKMSETTLSQWSQITEKAQVFGRKVGEAGNTKLGDALRNINKYLEKLDVDVIAKRLGDKLGELTDKAIAFGKFVWKWREPIAYIAGALTAALGAFAIVGVIAALVNPVALIAAGIAAAAVGLKALYDNSETFRGAIDGIVNKVKELWSAFKGGGTSGLINALFPPDIAKQVNSVVDGIKSKMAELTGAFKTGGIGGVFDKLFGEGSFESIKTKFEEFRAYATEKFGQLKGVFGRLKETFSQAFSTIADIIKNVWTIIEPYLSGFWNILQVIGDIAMIVFNNVIAPAISFLVQLFSTLWAVAKPILELLGIAWEALSTIIKWAWDNVLAPLVDFILTGVKNALDNFSEALSIVQGWFETLSGWISTAKGHVKDFIGFISSAKLPSWISNGISAGVNFVGNLMGAGDGKKGGKKSHYSGLDSVPYDGYSARLHKGERVLTARENKDYSEGNGGGLGEGIVITGNNFTVREDADVQRIAYELAKLIEKERTQVG
ncbi:phage tail protein [Lysinibacillus irui]|uniref:phage tail protein n=1 Tax=Lysinibacillus irui TaxID=2998077 RepID=UPI002AD54EF8|nr:phage tail tape measure protein [Lysinibacillus irui]MEA0562471.1 phage tail tape measure protein [Lysinibacillus irui]